MGTSVSYLIVLLVLTLTIVSILAGKLAPVAANNAVADDAQMRSEQVLMIKASMGTTQVSLNPEVADFVKSLAANLSSTQASTVVPPSNISGGINSVDQTSFRSPGLSDPPEALDKPSPGISNSMSSLSKNDSLQHDIWEVLEENYPDIKLHELSTERIRSLLEPLRDQLLARGISHINPYGICPPNTTHPPPTLPAPNFNRNPHPAYSAPPLHVPPPTSSDFRPRGHARPCPPLMTGGFRPAPRLNNPPPSQHFSPGLAPHFLPPPGPIRGAPPPRPRNIPYSRGPVGVRSRVKQPCRFFQQGQCRNGPACSFLH